MDARGGLFIGAIGKVEAVSLENFVDCDDFLVSNFASGGSLLVIFAARVDSVVTRMGESSAVSRLRVGCHNGCHWKI